MLHCTIAHALELEMLLQNVPGTPFREGIACIVLNGLSKATHATLTPITEETDDAFFDAIAFHLAFCVEGERPIGLRHYKDADLAYVLFERFMTGIIVLEGECVPNEELHRVTCIPELPPADACVPTRHALCSTPNMTIRHTVH